MKKFSSGMTESLITGSCFKTWKEAVVSILFHH